MGGTRECTFPESSSQFPVPRKFCRKIFLPPSPTPPTPGNHLYVMSAMKMLAVYIISTKLLITHDHFQLFVTYGSFLNRQLETDRQTDNKTRQTDRQTDPRQTDSLRTRRTERRKEEKGKTVNRHKNCQPERQAAD